MPKLEPGAVTDLKTFAGWRHLLVCHHKGKCLALPCAGASSSHWRHHQGAQELRTPGTCMARRPADHSRSPVLDEPIQLCQTACRALCSDVIAQSDWLLQDYCGLLSEDAVRKNFVLVYELLDEVIDYGYPQNSSSEALKQLVHNEPTIVKPPVSGNYPTQLAYLFNIINLDSGGKWPGNKMTG